MRAVLEPLYYARLGDLIFRCYQYGLEGQAWTYEETRCMDAAILGGAIAIVRTNLLQQLSWQRMNVTRMCSMHISFFVTQLQGLLLLLRRHQPWQRPWATAAAQEARDEEQELMRKLHNLAWSALVLGDRNNSDERIACVDGNLEQTHAYACNILAHLQGEWLELCSGVDRGEQNGYWVGTEAGRPLAAGAAGAQQGR